MIKLGDSIPQLVLKSASENSIKDFDLFENFKNKKNLLISVPGAFTSTCHNKHLPPFISNQDSLKQIKSIDEICCVSINDPYVMQQWSISLNAKNIIFLSDGNSDFGIQTNLMKPFKDSFMGMRLKRSIMLFDNLVLKKIITDETGIIETNYEKVLKNI